MTKSIIAKGHKLSVVILACIVYFQVDPSLIGGMVVNLGERYADMSTATKIKTYTNLIKQAV